MSFLFGAPGKGLDLYHVGLTVPDLHESMELYSAAFGFGWATVHERTPTVIVDGEPRQADIAVTYSVQGPPYLELVEERRGDIWGAARLSLTHVGFWAEDIARPGAVWKRWACRHECTLRRQTGRRCATAITRPPAGCG